MTRDEAVAAVQLVLGFRQDLAATIVTQLQHAQTHFEENWPDPSMLPYFLLSDCAIAYTVADEERVAKPDDWLADYPDATLWLKNSDDDYIALEKSSQVGLNGLYINSGSGFPSAYAFDGNYYRFFPKPDATYEVRTQYYQRDATLSLGSTENKWLIYAPYVLIGRAGAMLSSGSKNANFQAFLGLQNDAIASVQRRTTQESVQNRQFAMGEEL